MTQEERDQCRGMWCDFGYLKGLDCLAIFAGMSKRHHGYADVIYDGECGMITVPGTLTPRFDLPRAWNADGTPPKMKTEFARVEWDYIDKFISVLPDGDECIDEENFIHPNRTYRDGEAVAARFCTEWEPYQEQERTK
ncbi:hypothetical protein [Corynebacterium pseudopelargi]|nr:hypothetical protein [Corynebacterium pseudopelargi]